MTPKEKAEELFGKYATYAVMWTGGIEVEKQNCKQCALIAVDEIIKYLTSSLGVQVSLDAVNFWGNVKSELQSF